LHPHVVDGAARRPRARPRRAPDAGPLPGRGRRPSQRGGAGPHPARDAVRGGAVPLARRRARLLRVGRRHAPLRHAPLRAAHVGAARYSTRAAELKARFTEDFWLPHRGWFAVGLDHEKRPIDSLASNMGHCLWTGIVDAEKAEAVAEQLLSPAMFGGWGIRT